MTLSILLRTWKVASQQCQSYGWEESFTGSSARPSPRVRSPTENHEPAQDFQRGSSSPAPYMRANGLEKIGVFCT
ncbi:hypothetical protein AVEN_34922-1 [Araneus ventricosus]|uniref:Uncharacterized protein n=1 Tax=Araneus ventricosus TaxID=182803 RepID=A0A4Y2TNR8_ARAVE|nr:hypothetical protein AVEN_41243-1 [Araneus ventricosus]GBO00740.1 hypothetical protein AVEN_34922-1 [Araneus ventricosus]